MSPMPLIRFGLLGLLLWRTAVAFSRLRRTLGDRTARFRDRELRVALVRGRNSIERVSVGIDVPDRYRFVLRREKQIDGLAKWLRLAEEVQTGDAAFDAHVFVVSEDDRLRAALRADPSLRAAAVALLADPEVRAVRCNRGRLWIECDADLKSDVGEAEAIEPFAQRHLEALDRVAASLAAAPAPEWDAARGRAADHEHAIYAVCVALGIGAIVAFFWSQGHGMPRTLQFERVETIAIWFAAAAGLILLAAAVALLARTPRLHVVLLEIVVAAIPAAWFLSRTALAEHNIRAAQPRPREVVVQIVDRREHRGRRGRRTYSLSLAGWPDRSIDGWLGVPGGLYRATAGFDCLRVAYADGRLGDAWIAAAAPTRCDSNGY